VASKQTRSMQLSSDHGNGHSLALVSQSVGGGKPKSTEGEGINHGEELVLWCSGQYNVR
jgi:hypothetical protein